MSEEKDWIVENIYGDGSVNSSRQWRDKRGNVRKGYYAHTNITAYFDEQGRHHRIDGPARYRHNFELSEWYYHGEQIDCQSQEEYERILNLKAFW